MAYGLKYRLLWTNNQNNLDWRLDIEQEGYSGSLQTTYADGEPVELEYIADQDIYSPIIGSKLTMTLIETDTISYDDFNLLRDNASNLDPRAYRVTLRYKSPADASYDTYWRGFITPQDSDEAYAEERRGITVIATDGLNLVSDQQLVALGSGADASDETRVGEYIFDLVHQTGTQLPIRVYSDLRTTISGTVHYAVVETTVNDYVYFDENFDNPKSKAFAAKDILTAFNCRLFQSNGVWNVISNSNHAATIASNAENIPYKEYTYTSNSWGNGVENTSTNRLVRMPNDFKPSGTDLSILPRRPLFSIENRVAQQVGAPVNTNGFFSTAPGNSGVTDGMQWRNIGLGRRVSGDAKNYGTTRVTTGATLGTHLIQTTRTNDTDGSTRRDVWFECQVPYSKIRKSGTNLTVAMNQNWTQSNIASATVGISFALEYQDNDYFVYNFENNVWDQRKLNRRTAWDRYWTHLETTNDDKNQLNFFTVEIDNAGFSVRSFFESLSVFNVGGTDTLHIRIGDIKAYDENGNRVNANGQVTTKIDGVFLTNDLTEANKLEPFYERYQANFSETNTYNTSVYSDGSDAGRGKLSQDTYNRLGVTESQSLEQLVTQQKLNDHRASFPFYRGTLVGLTTGRPLHLVDKIRNAFSNGDTRSSILHYFRFRPKSNTYDFQAYLPNQTSDHASTFVKEDVFPAVTNYSWREDIIRYDVDLDLSGVTLPTTGISTTSTGTNAAGATTMNVTSTADFPSAGWVVVGSQVIRYTGKTSTSFTGIPATGTGRITTSIAASTTVKAGINAYLSLGLPSTLDADDNPIYGRFLDRSYPVAGEEKLFQYIISPINQDDYEINASDWGISNSSTIDAEDLEIEDLGIPIRIAFSLPVDDYSDIIQVTVTGEVDDLVGDNVTYTVTKGTVSSGVSAASITSQVQALDSTNLISVHVTPNTAGQQITLANCAITVTAYDSSDAALSGVVGTIEEIKEGVGVRYLIPIKAISTLDDVGYTITATPTALPSGVTTSTLTITASESGTDTSNFSITDTSIDIIGVVGTTYQAIFEVEADSGRYFTLDSISATTTDSNITNTYVVYKSNTEYLVYVEGVMPSSNATATTAISATTSDTPPADTSNVSFTSTGSSLTSVTVTNPVTQIGLQGTKEVAVYEVSPTNGREITTAPTIGTVTDSNNAVTDSEIVISKSGTGYRIIVPYTYQDTNATVNVPITASSTAISTDVTTSTITVTATESGTNTAEFILNDSSHQATGVNGTTSLLGPFEVEAASGYIISNVSVGSTEESFIGTIIDKQITPYESLVWVTVNHGTTNQTGAITIGATTSDDDGEEIGHAITTQLAAGVSNCTITVNSGSNTLEIDPGDTTEFKVTVEGDDSYDVADMTATVSDGDTYIVSTGDTTYRVNGQYTTVKEFNFRVTGQSTAQTATITIAGTPTLVETYQLVMALDSTDSGQASVNKTHLKWTYSADELGNAGTSQTFTVQSNDPLRNYTSDTDFSAGQHFIEGDQSGSAALGTINIEKSRSGGVFTFTVTPTFGSTAPATGRYDGEFILVENELPYRVASSATFDMNPVYLDRTAKSGTNAVKVGWVSNGTVVGSFTSGGTGASATLTEITKTSGIVTFTLPAVTSDTTRNYALFPTGQSGSLSNAIASVHIQQRANNASQVDGTNVRVVSSLPASPDSGTIYIVTA